MSLKVHHHKTVRSCLKLSRQTVSCCWGGEFLTAVMYTNNRSSHESTRGCFLEYLSTLVTDLGKTKWTRGVARWFKVSSNLLCVSYNSGHKGESLFSLSHMPEEVLVNRNNLIQTIYLESNRVQISFVTCFAPESFSSSTWTLKIKAKKVK